MGRRQDQGGKADVGKPEVAAEDHSDDPAAFDWVAEEMAGEQ